MHCAPSAGTYAESGSMCTLCQYRTSRSKRVGCFYRRYKRGSYGVRRPSTSISDVSIEHCTAQATWYRTSRRNTYDKPKSNTRDRIPDPNCTRRLWFLVFDFGLHTAIDAIWSCSRIFPSSSSCHH
eukprot:3941481-Rhodomonas_salina.6